MVVMAKLWTSRKCINEINSSCCTSKIGKFLVSEKKMYALYKLVPSSQVYEVNAAVIIVTGSLLELVRTVCNLNSEYKRHQILCICSLVENHDRSSSSSDKEDIISDIAVSKLPGT